MFEKGPVEYRFKTVSYITQKLKILASHMAAVEWSKWLQKQFQAIFYGNGSAVLILRNPQNGYKVIIQKPLANQV